MKVVLLAGGYGTRLSEETSRIPKPMVEIGGKPIIWHIMKLYGYHGFTDFVILLGYKGYCIKEYFANYLLHQSDVTIDLQNSSVEVLSSASEPWKVTLLDTGLETMTGGRIKRAQQIIGDERFMLTYGDGVSNVNIKELVAFHESHGKALTVTSAQPEGRFGALSTTKEDQVTHFMEKPKGDSQWINAGFFVCEPQVFQYITEGDSTVWEQAPLRNLSIDGQIYTYRHRGFWRPMDTLRDMRMLNELWDKNSAEWKVWASTV